MNIDDFSKQSNVVFHVEFLNYDIEVSVDLESGKKIDDYELLITNINNWDSSFFKKLEPMLYAFYKDTLLMTGETKPIIEKSTDIWKFLHIRSLTPQSYKNRFFIMACGSCDWEEEHRFEFDVNESDIAVYLGKFINNGFYEDPEKPGTYNFIDGNPY